MIIEEVRYLTYWHTRLNGAHCAVNELSVCDPAVRIAFGTFQLG
jgi:hypothetical protein